jgi:hypothetical protein
MRLLIGVGENSGRRRRSDGKERDDVIVYVDVIFGVKTFEVRRRRSGDGGEVVDEEGEDGDEGDEVVKRISTSNSGYEE